MSHWLRWIESPTRCGVRCSHCSPQLTGTIIISTTIKDKPLAAVTLPNNKSSDRAYSRKNRIFTFYQFLLDTYGRWLQDSNDDDVVVLDVAGGKGALSWLIMNHNSQRNDNNNINNSSSAPICLCQATSDLPPLVSRTTTSIVLDPQVFPHSQGKPSFLTRSTHFLRAHPAEAVDRAVPNRPSHQPLAALLPGLATQLVEPEQWRISVDAKLVRVVQESLQQPGSDEETAPQPWKEYWNHHEQQEPSSFSTGCDAAWKLLCRTKLVAGFHPDQATEPAIQLAIALQVPFCVVPCCVFPNMFPQRRYYCQGGEERHVRDYHSFLLYLQQQYPNARSAQLDFLHNDTAEISDAVKRVVLYMLPSDSPHL